MMALSMKLVAPPLCDIPKLHSERSDMHIQTLDIAVNLQMSFHIPLTNCMHLEQGADVLACVRRSMVCCIDLHDNAAETWMLYLDGTSGIRLLHVCLEQLQQCYVDVSKQF